MKTQVKIILLTILLLVWHPADTSAKKRHIKFDRITIEQGLSQNSVTAVLQDRKGFMWFGTMDGLNRYDGYRFTVYKNRPETTGSLSRGSEPPCRRNLAGAGNQP